MGIDGKDHTFTANALTIPEGYELVANFADVTVKYGETVSVEVAVKAISEPEVPVEMANATLHILTPIMAEERNPLRILPQLARRAILILLLLKM